MKKEKKKKLTEPFFKYPTNIIKKLIRRKKREGKKQIPKNPPDSKPSFGPLHPCCHLLLWFAGMGSAYKDTNTVSNLSRAIMGDARK